MPHILFVVNSKAGKDRKTDYEKVIRDFYADEPESISFFDLPCHNAAQKLKDAIRVTQAGTVVAVGGDGTITFVINALLEKDIALGIIPAGSANGMARELMIPADTEKALQILKNGEKRKADVIQIGNKFCFHLSDVGLNAQLVKYFEEGTIRGMLGYARALVKALLHKRRMKVLITTKEGEIERSAVMVAIANATKYGTGAVINPEGNIYDGFFEVVIVRKLGILSILKMFLKFARFNPGHIEVIQAKRVHIGSQKNMHFQIDGEYLGKTQEVEAKIIPAALTIIAPSNHG